MLGAILGFASGFLGSVPVTGPIALLVFRSSLRGSFSSAMHIVLGASIAEALYCALATFGYIQIITAYPFLTKYIRYMGSIFLLLLGVLFLFQKIKIVDEETPVVSANEKRGGFFTGFMISLLNPTLFLTWGSATSTIFSWFNAITVLDMVLFPIAAGLGIVCWFFLLLEIFKKFRVKIGERIGYFAIRGAALLLIGLGIYMLSQVNQ
ncbi:MAG TPA: LysE family transporter [Turneriella sp.]|nr:LysE family transporter [Turneriella sp.]